jgi:hypothetical protein
MLVCCKNAGARLWRSWQLESQPSVIMYVGNHGLCGSQMERRACTLLHCMENPAKKHKCIKELYGLGEDVVVR